MLTIPFLFSVFLSLFTLFICPQLAYSTPDIPSNTVLNLNGIDGYAEVLHQDKLSPKSQISFEAWAYMDDWKSLNYKTAILDKSDHGAGGYGLWFSPVSGGQINLAAVIRIGAGYLQASFNHTILTSGWHHFAVTYDHRYLKLYVDGTLVQTADPGSVSDIGYPYKYVLRFGRMARNDGVGFGYFKGRIDAARIYDRALTQDEITNHYNGGAGQLGGIESGLVGGWDFDEGTGSIINDYSGNGFSGVLVNGAQWIDRELLPNSIGGISVTNITVNSAQINWVSSELANSRIDYGASATYGAVVKDAVLSTSHSMTISGLSSGTVYHFQLTSVNAGSQKAISLDCTFTTLFPAPTDNKFFVAPDGSPFGNGSQGSPWDLQTALNHPASVLPGATIWLLGGVYQVPQNPGNWISNLKGTAVNPIKVMSYPGECATLDGNLYNKQVKNMTMLKIFGQYTWFMDFEMTNSDLNGRILTDIRAGGDHSNPSHRRANSVDDYGVGTKLINLIIHDTGQGIGAWVTGKDNEYYGNIVYNNGWDDDLRGHGHGTYVQNKSGYKQFINNIFFNHFGVNTRTGGTDDSAVRNLTWVGNVFFNGSTAWEGPHIENLKVLNNFTYYNHFKIGYEPNSTYINAEVSNNYFMAGVSLFDFMQGLIFTNNVVWNSDPVGKDMSLSVTESWTPSRFTMSNNTYYKATNAFPFWHFKVQQYPTYGPILLNYSGDYAFNKTQDSQARTYGYTKKSWQDDLKLDLNSTYIDTVPSGLMVFVQSNQYDPKRAHVIIYNWDKLPTVIVPKAQINGVLSVGDNYELRNVQDYFGDVITGTYAGGDLSIPMTGRTFAKPVGADLVAKWYHDPFKVFVPTFPEFGVFVLIKTGSEVSGTSTVTPNKDDPKVAPVVKINLALDQSTYVAPANIILNANISVANGTVSQVQFLNGKDIIGTKFAAPFIMPLTNIPAGTYTFWAKATDNKGLVTTSNVIVTVKANIPPIISFSALSVDGQVTPISPANIILNANAKDEDGAITKVDFYNGTTLIKTITASPYTFLWSNVPAGTYVLTAKATDDKDEVTTSLPANLTVNKLPDAASSVSTPNVLNNANLVGYWNFDDRTAKDCSQVDSNNVCNGSNPGALIDAATVVTDPMRGKVLNISGTKSYVNMGDQAGLNLPGDFTVAAWIKMTGFGQNNTGRILQKSVNNGGYDFFVLNNAPRTKSLGFQSAGGSTYYSNTNVVNTGEWQHVAFIRAGSTGTFYVNGRAQGTSSVTTANNTSSAPFNIGIAGNLSGYFQGSIDDVRVYTRALTANEINAVCGNCQPDTIEPTLTSIIAQNVMSDSATINWDSDEASDMQVQYGLDSNYGNRTTLNSALVINHADKLTGLSPGTVYHYRVISKDAGGNMRISSDNTFTTASIGGSTTVTQDMFYTKPGLYGGSYYNNGYHYQIAEPFDGHYVKADDLRGVGLAKVRDNTFYGNDGGAATTYSANENAIKLSVTAQNVIPLDFVNLKPGVYFIRVVGRVNQPSIPRIVKPLMLNFSINDGPNGEVHQYRMKVLYSNYLEETGRIFFNALNNVNNLHGELSVSADSQEDLLVHRIDFFDALAGATIKKVKTSASTYIAAEQSYIQTHPPAGLKNSTIPHGLIGQARQDRDDVIWNAFPPINSMHTGDGANAAYSLWPDGLTNEQMASQYGIWSLDVRKPEPWYAINDFDMPWKLVNSKLKDEKGNYLTYTLDDYINHRPLPDPYPCKDAGFGCYFAANSFNSPGTYHFIIAPLILQRMQMQYSGAIYGQGSDGGADVAYLYYVKQDSDAARDISLALVRFALQWPAQQMSPQGMAYNSANPDLDFGGNFHWAESRPGKIYYNGWTGDKAVGYAQAYDYLYSYISGNEELAKSVHRYVPWVNSPDDVIALLDTYLLETTYNDSTTGRISLDNPFLIGLVLQNGPLAQKLMDMSKVQFNIHPLGTTSMKRHYRTSIGQDGTVLIGSLNYAMGESILFLSGTDPIARYKVMSGQNVIYDLTDLKKYPKIREYANTFSNILVAGGYMSPFGDSGNGIDSPRHVNDAYVPSSYLRNMWEYGGQNPKVAWLLKNIAGRTDQNDAQWSAIVAAAATTRDPRLSSDSRVFNGFGLGILESGVASNNYRDKSAIVIRTGTGQGHAHNNALDLAWYALGLRMGTPYGTRNDSATTFSVPADNASYVHNTVEVDGYIHPLKAKNGWPAGSFTTAEAWVDSFAPGTGSQYISAQGKSADHANVDIFRRDSALFDIDDSHAYVFDVFRVGGGQMHTWCFHGADTNNENGGMTINTVMSSNLDSDAANYLRKFANGTTSQGIAPAGKLEVTWRLGRTAATSDMNNGDGSAVKVATVAAEQSMLGPDYNASAPRKYTKVTLFDRKDDKVMTGNLYSGFYKINQPNILVQSGTGGTFDPKGNKQDVYPAIIEAYEGASQITSSDSLAVEPNESDALKAVALSATLTNGNNDIMFSDGRNTTRTVNISPNSSMKVNARSAYFSTKNGAFRMMNIVGGTELSNGSYSLKPSIGIISSTIKSVDYQNQKIYTTSKIPMGLINRDFRIFNTDHHTAYTIVAIADSDSGSVLTYSKPADIAEISVDGISTNILTSAQSWTLDYVANRNKGFSATNESGSKAFKIGKASRNSGETKNTISNDASGQPMSLFDFNDDDGDSVAQAIIYDFGFGDTIEVDSNVVVKSIGNNVYSILTVVDTELTVPGNGNIEVSLDQEQWISLSTVANQGLVTARIPANKAVQYIKISANLTVTIIPFSSTIPVEPVVPTIIPQLDYQEINHAPSATDQTITFNEDGSAKTIVLNATDPDAGDNQLTYEMLTPNNPALGSLIGTMPNVIYTPANNTNGTDSFTYKVTDSKGLIAQATVTITINSVNDAPEANDASVTVQRDISQAMVLTGTDIDGDPLTYAIVRPPLHGTLSGTPPNLKYTPLLEYTGIDNFSFKVNDSKENSEEGNVSITVVPRNHPPQANAQTMVVIKNVAKTITLSGGDQEGSPLTYIVVDSPKHGTLTQTGADVTYKPNADYYGEDSFKFKANDKTDDSVVVSVDIIVVDVLTARIDVNAEGHEPLTIYADASLSTDPKGVITAYRWDYGDGSSSVSGIKGEHVYQKAGDYTLTLQVTNENQKTATATRVIHVLVNQPPSVKPINVVTIQGAPLTIPLQGFDPENKALTYTIDDNQLEQSVAILKGNKIIYVPQGDFVGNETITYNVSDGFKTSLNGVITIKVKNPPTAIMTTSVSEGTVPLRVTFDASQSKSSDAGGLSYSWKLTDGTMLNGVSPIYEFDLPGEYQVQLTVTDADGIQVGSAIKTINVRSNPTVISFNGNENNQEDVKPFAKNVGTGLSIPMYLSSVDDKVSIPLSKNTTQVNIQENKDEQLPQDVLVEVGNPIEDKVEAHDNIESEIKSKELPTTQDSQDQQSALDSVTKDDVASKDSQSSEDQKIKFKINPIREQRIKSNKTMNLDVSTLEANGRKVDFQVVLGNGDSSETIGLVVKNKGNGKARLTWKAKHMNGNTDQIIVVNAKTEDGQVARQVFRINVIGWAKVIAPTDEQELKEPRFALKVLSKDVPRMTVSVFSNEEEAKKPFGDILFKKIKPNAQLTVDNVPLTGNPVYVRLSYFADNRWQHKDVKLKTISK